MKHGDKTMSAYSATRGEKIRNAVVATAIALLLVVAIINFVSRIVEFNELQSEKEALEQEINDTKNNIEELEYWIAAPMDDDYIMKFAREKLELYRADEIVFVGDAGKD
jgi:cell division protein FtsB